MVSIPVTSLLSPFSESLKGHPGNWVIRIVYVDDAGNVKGMQNINVDNENPVDIGEDKITIHTTSFTPNIPEGATKFKIMVRTQAYNFNVDVLYLGEFNINILKRATPPYVMHITITSGGTSGSSSSGSQ